MSDSVNPFANRHLNPDGTVRSAIELVAVILEYEHALEHIIEDHEMACTDCQRLAQGALDGHNADDFLAIARDAKNGSDAPVVNPALSDAAARRPEIVTDRDGEGVRHHHMSWEDVKARRSDRADYPLDEATAPDV